MYYSIKELEHYSGVKAHTLRIWEQRYNFFSPERTETNIRKYDVIDLKKVLNTSSLIENGYKISKIAQLSETQMNDAILKSDNNCYKYHIELNELTISLLEFDEAKFSNVYKNCKSKLGVKYCFLEVLFPLLQKVGMLWSTNEATPANEHFISNLIKQKLHAEIEALASEKKSREKSVIHFLPTSNFHEIGLLLSHYISKSENINSIYLGQDVPLESVLHAVEKLQPDYLITSIYNSNTLSEFEKYLTKLSDSFGNQVYVGTTLIKEDTKLKNCKNIKFINNLDFISNL